MNSGQCTNRSYPAAWETPFSANKHHTLLGVWGILHDKNLCVIREAHVGNVQLLSVKRRGEHTLQQTRWSHSKVSPHTIGVSQLVWHHTICGPVYPRELCWSCGADCVCVCVCVIIYACVWILFSCWTARPKWFQYLLKARTKIVSLVQADPINYSTAHNANWTLLCIVMSYTNRNRVLTGRHSI